MPPMFGVSIRYTIIKTFNTQLNTLLFQYFSSITHKPSTCLHYQPHTRLPTSLRQHSLTQPSLQQVQSLVRFKLPISLINDLTSSGLEVTHKPSLKEKIQRKLSGSVDPTKKPADPYKSWEARAGQYTTTIITSQLEG
ncbi:uncharacterized protein B0J16DRAFT_330195 [Fusarium flagelliforme]|uniref:uncharacterized protein n=1 Tax=Fusarium flagelliforme TaxID=2675880 RepID=UPI001E8E11D1|nr:uncharacterized protein B0J16DRAFT_330195 [Fusarium flagelliforme]KAH7198295.1 hypothetical protein B0J16DRAFT_330195 [Fusarium flagelliforme]